LRRVWRDCLQETRKEKKETVMNFLSNIQKSYSSTFSSHKRVRLQSESKSSETRFTHCDKKWTQSPAKHIFQPYSQPYSKSLTQGQSLSPVPVPKRAYSVPSGQAAADAAAVAEFAKANGLSRKDILSMREAVKGVTISTILESDNPEDIKALATFSGFLNKKIQEDPEKSTFENEEVLKVSSASKGQPFSNFLMHLKKGGQNGVHVHPYGARNLPVISPTPCSVFVGRTPAPGEDAADVNEIVEIKVKPGIYTVSLEANKPHGFDSEGDDTSALSVHATDDEEVRLAGIKDSNDVMAQLTRPLGSEGKTFRSIPLKVAKALQALPLEAVLAMQVPDTKEE
jgi:hypothetical protein